MFFELTENGMTEIEPGKIDPERLTVGYVNVDELVACAGLLGFDENTVSSCRNANSFFRSGVEVHQEYTFTELRIMNLHEEADDYIALYLKRDLIIVVDIVDRDGSTKEKFFAAVKKYPFGRMSCEKILAAFLELLLSGDHAALERIETDLEDQEESLIRDKLESGFDMELLKSKKRLSRRAGYYAQLMDITDAVHENDNGIFDERQLIHIDNISMRLGGLREETARLRSTVEHLQDAYSSYLDMKLNKTMKLFTVLTSIFFPLTIIVGWYGMNFQNMPELAWRYGYIYVIVLSVITVAAFFIIGKRRKWF